MLHRIIIIIIASINALFDAACDLKEYQ